jgi:hypothetical protein
MIGLRKILLMCLLATADISYANTEKITLICKYDSGPEMMPFNIDLNTKIVIWGNVITKPGEEWRLVGNNDRFLTIKSPDTKNTRGGIVVVVDRFSGKFGISHVLVGHEDTISTKSGEGTCNRKQF